MSREHAGGREQWVRLMLQVRDERRRWRLTAGASGMRSGALPADVVERLARDDDRVVQLFLAESCDDASAEMLLRVWRWWTGGFSHPGRPLTHPR